MVLWRKNKVQWSKVPVPYNRPPVSGLSLILARENFVSKLRWKISWKPLFRKRKKTDRKWRRRLGLYSQANYRNRQRALRRERYRDRFAFLSDYYHEPVTRKPSYLRILNGDYLDLVPNYDDYDYDFDDERDYIDDLLDERGAAAALIESKLLDRQLRRFLRRS